MLLSAVYARLICNIVAYLYPAYMTYRSLKPTSLDSEQDEEHETETILIHNTWLTYWITCAAFTVFEMFADQVLSSLPLYFELKVLFLLWFVSPRFMGAQKIYVEAIRPQLVRYEKEIDDGLRAVAQRGTEQMARVKQAGVDAVLMNNANSRDEVLGGLLSAAAHVVVGGGSDHSDVHARRRSVNEQRRRGSSVDAKVVD